MPWYTDALSGHCEDQSFLGLGASAHPITTVSGKVAPGISLVIGVDQGWATLWMLSKYLAENFASPIINVNIKTSLFKPATGKLVNLYLNRLPL